MKKKMLQSLNKAQWRAITNAISSENINIQQATDMILTFNEFNEKKRQKKAAS